jgi:hypothetical protein
MPTPEELMRGPRGRRLCLSYLTEVDEAVRSAVFWLGRELDPHSVTLFRIGEDDTEDAAEPTSSEAEVAAAIRQVDLTSVSPATLREALCDTVDQARYWQEPDAEDMVAALPAVRHSLTPVSERLIAMMPSVTATSAPAQWTVDWRVESDSAPIERDPAAVLRRWTSEQREDEETSARERPADPRAPWSGSWWSVPQALLETRADPLDALQLVEDAFDGEVATVIPVSGAGRIREIRSADDWADLCREYPTEVTASRRHDWFRVTGRDGRWLIPDWERVAQHWDAVHLSTWGYLCSATTLIDVDSEYATVLAGWGPDSTLWLADVARERDEPRQMWNRLDGGNVWVRAETTGS